MSDGRVKNGGARTGAGRKAKAVEAELQRLLKSCWTKEDREACFQMLAQDARSTVFRVRNEARKQLLAYAFGKPTQRVIIEDEKPEGGKGRVDLSKLNSEELEILERAGEIVTRARRGTGGEGQA